VHEEAQIGTPVYATWHVRPGEGRIATDRSSDTNPRMADLRRERFLRTFAVNISHD